MAKKVSKEKLLNDAYHLCEFMLIMMNSIRDNEHEFDEREIGRVLSLYYAAIKPFEDFLLQCKLLENEDYEEIFNYAEGVSKKYSIQCPCSKCGN